MARLRGVCALDRRLGSAVRADEASWYGLIEIGATGIKVVALPIDAAGSADLTQVVKKLPHKAVNNVTLKDLKGGKFQPEAIAEAARQSRTFTKTSLKNETSRRSTSLSSPAAA